MASPFTTPNLNWESENLPEAFPVALNNILFNFWWSLFQKARKGTCHLSTFVDWTKRTWHLRWMALGLRGWKIQSQQRMATIWAAHRAKGKSIFSPLQLSAVPPNCRRNNWWFISRCRVMAEKCKLANEGEVSGKWLMVNVKYIFNVHWPNSLG